VRKEAYGKDGAVSSIDVDLLSLLGHLLLNSEFQRISSPLLSPASGGIQDTKRFLLSCITEWSFLPSVKAHFVRRVLRLAACSTPIQIGEIASRTANCGSNFVNQHLRCFIERVKKSAVFVPMKLFSAAFFSLAIIDRH